MDYNNEVVLGQKPIRRIIETCQFCSQVNEIIPQGHKFSVKCYNCNKVFIVLDKSNSEHSSSTSNIHSNTRRNSTSDEIKVVRERDTEYYEVLGVDQFATQEEIRRGYYKMARIYHPDKNQGDASAAAKFQKVSEAYQVLSDPKLKDKYDKFGKEGTTPDAGYMNPKEFFNRMFGGFKFEPFIGELSIGDAPDESRTAEQREKEYKERIDMLHRNLIERLDPHIQGRTEEFEETSKLTIEELKDVSFGKELLHAIGYIYEQEAAKRLGGVTGAFAGVTGFAHLVKETVSATGAAITLTSMKKELEATNENTTAEAKEELEKKLMNEGMNAMFKLGKLEIEFTLRKVCDLLLKDATVDKIVLKKRAAALQLLGRMFKAA